MATPADLTGKVLWLRAKDLPGSAGSAVTTWPDQSGGHNDAKAAGTTPTLATSSTPNGGKSVAFGGSGYFTLLDTIFAGGADARGWAPSEDPFRAFDGNTGTQWTDTGAGSGSWLSVRAKAQAVLTAYSIRVRSGWNDRSPKSWIMQGSNDNQTWVDLDSRSGQAFADGGTNNYTVSGAAAYQFYRLWITQVNASSIVNVTELTLTGPSLVQTAAEAWFVVKSGEASGNFRGLSSLGNSEVTSPSMYPSTDGTIQETAFIRTFAGTDRRIFTPSVPITQWRLYRVSNDGSAYEIRLDEQLQSSTPGLAFDHTHYPRLGANLNASQGFFGNVAEVLIRDRVATSAEVADLITYFNTEHGLTVPGGSPPGVNVTVAPTALTGTGTLPAPTVTATSQLDVTVAAPALAGTGQILAPDVATPSGIVISPAPLTSTGELPAPTVTATSGSSDVTVDAPVLAGSGALPTPNVVQSGTELLAGGIALGGQLTNRVIALAPQHLEGGFAFGSTATTTSIAPQRGMAGGFKIGGSIRQARPWGTNPRTGRPDVRVVIVTRDGRSITTHTSIYPTPLKQGVNVPDDWTFKVSRLLRVLTGKILPIACEAQLWRGDVLMTRGPIGPGTADDRSASMTYPASDPSWSLRGGRRVIGRVPKRQWLKNEGFTLGLANWTGTYGPDSALKAPPKMKVVHDDYAVSGFALEMGAVDKVVISKSEVSSAAVFVPNSATYLKGGEDKVKAAAKDIPDGATIHLVGHTADDGTGDGLDLSLRRAQAAKATLAGMGKGFKFSLPPGWSKIPAAKRKDDGTVGGRGLYASKAPNRTEAGRKQNRRVEIGYEGVQKAEGHDQYVRQLLRVRQDESARVPLTVTLAGDMRILRWDAAPKDGAAMQLILQDIVATKEIAETGAVFAPNSATYLAGGEDKIKAIGEKIPEGATITLVGHTADNRRNGDPGNGLDLSLSRAKAAKATLAGMNKKFVFKLPTDWSKIDPAKRKDDGSVGGRGYYDKVATNATDSGQAKNRRVEIGYTAKVVVDAGDDSSVEMNELTPRVRWAHYETSVDIPADGKTRTLEVRLYPPAGASRWANVGLWPHDQLGFFDTDQSLIVKALTEHVQDPAMGKGDLGIKTRTPRTGVVRTKEYPFHERMPWETAVEWFTAIDRGLDIDCEVTEKRATIVTHYPRQGSPSGYELVHGGRKSNISSYKPLTTSPDGLASSIIMQADGYGAARPEAYARNTPALGGTLLEAVISAEDQTPPAELAEGALGALGSSLHPQPGWEVTIKATKTTEVLDAIGKGDTARLVLPDEGVDGPHRMVLREWDPAADIVKLTMIPEEA